MWNLTFWVDVGMKCVALFLVLVFLTWALAEVEANTSHRITINGQYIAVEHIDREGIRSREPIDLANVTVVVSREESSKNDEIETVELASGKFVEGKVSLQIEVDEPTKAVISVVDGKNRILNCDILIVPDEQNISFALIDRNAADSDQLLLVGASRQAEDLSKKFSVSGTYDLKDGQKAPGYLSANLMAYEYLSDGTPVQIDFGTVLLHEGRYLVESEADEPRVATLTISRGAEFVWSTPLVIEPNATIEIARRGPANTLIASAKNGRHAKLVDSWRMNKDFLSKGHAMLLAPISERQKRIDELWTIRIKALKELALNSEDPFNSLIALELTADFYGGDYGLIDKQDKLQLFDKLAAKLDKNVVARRITPPRNRMVANMARIENSEKLTVGKEAPNIVLANLSGEEVDLKENVSKMNLVLVEFWASWCAPCIAKFPTLKDLYSKYHDNGFEIVTVSLDSSTDDWEQVSTAHKIPWIDLGDENGFFGIPAVEFGVGLVPTNIVLDGKQQIVAKNLDLDKLEQLLETRIEASTEGN